MRMHINEARETGEKGETSAKGESSRPRNESFILSQSYTPVVPEPQPLSMALPCLRWPPGVILTHYLH